MNCKYHPDRLGTHVVDVLTLPLMSVCDECAEAERQIGALNVAKHELDEATFPCGHPSYMQSKENKHYCQDYPDGLET